MCPSTYVSAHGTVNESFPWRLDVSVDGSQTSSHRPRWRLLYILCIFLFLQAAHATLGRHSPTPLVRGEETPGPVQVRSFDVSHLLWNRIAPSGCTSRVRSHMTHVLWNMDADAWAVCGILSLPHLLYAWLWTRPQDLRNVAERPVATFANLAYALKGVQFATVVYWWMQTQENVFEWKDTNLLQVILAAVLLAIGQALNVGIYRAIGKPGVYYGCRLGESVPWHDGFPFNVVRHPQYVGAVLTVWGMVSLVFRTAHPGLLGVATFWTTLYTITALVEDYL